MTQTRNQRRDRRRMAVITVLSLLVHVGVFALIGLNTPGVRERLPLPDEVIDISLAPSRPQPRLPSPVQAGGSPAEGIPRRDTTAPLLHVPAVEPPSAVAPSPLPAPAPSGAATGAKKGGSGRTATVFPSAGDEARKALRGTYGCAYPDASGLNRREREACFDRGGKWDREVTPIDAPMAAAKRERFDQVAAKQRRDREWREAPPVAGGPNGEVTDLRTPF